LIDAPTLLIAVQMQLIDVPTLLIAVPTQLIDVPTLLNAVPTQLNRCLSLSKCCLSLSTGRKFGMTQYQLDSN